MKENETGYEVDILAKKWSKEKYSFVDSMNLIALLNSNFIYPIAMEQNGRFKTCIYIKDDIGYESINKKWNDGTFDELKLYAKSFRKCKKAFATGNIDDFKNYR